MGKRTMALLMAAALVLALGACGGAPGEPSQAAPEPPRAESPAPESGTETPEPSAPSPEEAPETPPESEGEAEPEETGEPKVGVVYFSATGTTAKVARLIADETGGELFELVPEQPYTAEDLAYTNDDCRANREMKAPEVRPAISGDVSGAYGCDVLYLGYPIWWGTAPRIIQTFLEGGELEGKTIHLFCTSGGSGVDQSVRDLQGLYPGAGIADGKRLNGATQADIQAWIASLGS